MTHVPPTLTRPFLYALEILLGYSTYIENPVPALEELLISVGGDKSYTAEVAIKLVEPLCNK